MNKYQKQKIEVYNHRIIWAAAEKNLQLANSSNKDAKFFALGSMFLCFAAFEGYLNWLGARIAPDVWKNEREFFSHRPFQGTLGKYRFLVKILCLPDPTPGCGPFQTAKRLLELRDMVAHPKPEARECPVKFKDGYFPPFYQGRLEEFVSVKDANRAREHLKELADTLHTKAQQAHLDKVEGSEAFGFVLQMEITDTE